jgi:tRNA A37 threonylcarbamoyladenosine synthetase subunit TsaC/SUA5/YrdC
LTALGTGTISVANTATVYGFGSSTVAKAYVKRMAQIQDDLENLMAKIDSTGLINITGGVS